VNGSVSATTFVGDGSAPTGVGKITTVTAGSGLTGGGSAGSVSLTIDSTVARTNASNTFTANQTVDGSGTANSDPGIFYFWGREVETALHLTIGARWPQRWALQSEFHWSAMRASRRREPIRTAAASTLVRQPQHGLAAIAYDLTPVIDVGRLRLTGR